MRYVKRTILILSAIMLLFGAMVASVSAQSRTVVVSRPVIVRTYDPFWGWGWHNSYWNDPYYWEQRQRYYDRQSVRDAEKKLSKDRAKYNADGYLTPKEQEKLAKDQQNYYKAVERLRRNG